MESIFLDVEEKDIDGRFSRFSSLYLYSCMPAFIISSSSFSLSSFSSSRLFVYFSFGELHDRLIRRKFTAWKVNRPETEQRITVKLLWWGGFFSLCLPLPYCINGCVCLQMMKRRRTRDKMTKKTKEERDRLCVLSTIKEKEGHNENTREIGISLSLSSGASVCYATVAVIRCLRKDGKRRQTRTRKYQ